jgi:hypothetical protein
MAIRMHAERPQPAHRAGPAGADARAPCLQARARLHAVGSLVGSLVQLQHVSLPGLLVTAGQAPRPGDVARAGALLDACALAGARDLQVCAHAQQLFGLCGRQSVLMPDLTLRGACCVTLQNVNWRTLNAFCWQAKPERKQVTCLDMHSSSYGTATCLVVPWCLR